jgi:hypothetical protein
MKVEILSMEVGGILFVHLKEQEAVFPHWRIE